MASHNGAVAEVSTGAGQSGKKLNAVGSSNVARCRAGISFNVDDD